MLILPQCTCDEVGGPAQDGIFDKGETGLLFKGVAHTLTLIREILASLCIHITRLIIRDEKSDKCENLIKLKQFFKFHFADGKIKLIHILNITSKYFISKYCLK